MVAAIINDDANTDVPATAVQDVKEDSDGDLLDLDNIYIEIDDFMKASKRVQPSAQREGFSTVPNTSWGDVGALVNVRAEL